ncbi:MAG: spermidine/putrescine ABC transporter substrate-binding protein [Geminicoccaceae bacterium]|nr:spermidine/putrescine ABC transporter substrate-binding protein [Geminicoccaceae bacterium]
MPRRRPSPSAVLGRRGFLGRTLTVATTAALLPQLAPRLARAQGRQVNVYNWDTYIGETTIEDFQSATGITVRYDLFGSSDELFAKLRQGNPGYDVAYPSSEYVARMVEAGIVEPLDKAKIPNAKNIDPQFANPAYDPGRAYSLPYFWGTIGVGYRKSVGEVKALKDLFEGDAFDGRISFLNSKDTIQQVLKYLGHSINTTDPKEIDAAADALVRIKPKIKTFTPDTGQDLLVSGEVDACGEYNGDILQVMAEDDDLAYAVPTEGAPIWEDVMCIPKGPPHPDEAHEWINFIYDAPVHAAIAEYVQFGCPNAAARALLPQEQRDDPTLYPPPEVLERCEFIKYQGEEVAGLLEAALTKVLAA